VCLTRMLQKSCEDGERVGEHITRMLPWNLSLSAELFVEMHIYQLSIVLA